jgi:hypothetical protein
MGKRTGAKYRTMPEVPPEVASRLDAVVKVLADRSTISSEAESLGLTRQQMQSLVHRGIEQLIVGVTPRRPGPEPMSRAEQELRAENERLRRELRVAQTKSEMTERFLSVAGELIRGRTSARRSREPSASRRAASPTKDPSGEGERRARLAAAEVLFGEATMEVIATVVGTSTSSLFRWRRRARAEKPLAFDRGGGPAQTITDEQRAAVETAVRRSRGLIGADALRIKVPGISRRAARRMKSSTCRQMELERLAAATPVEVSAPGVMRGFDAMHLRTTDGRRYVLIAADASIPYRTSALLVARYDESSVLRALEADFASNGLPLVLRMDRASCQSTPRVRQMLASNQVLLLRGPAHHPGYYGQLERQNRDHRAWLEAGGLVASDQLEAALPEMLAVMNAELPRRDLGWQTAEALWTSRGVICENRAELVEEVGSAVRRIAEAQRDAGVDEHVALERAERFGIEATLMRRGYLRIG